MVCRFSRHSILTALQRQLIILCAVIAIIATITAAFWWNGKQQYKQGGADKVAEINRQTAEQIKRDTQDAINYDSDYASFGSILDRVFTENGGDTGQVSNQGLFEESPCIPTQSANGEGAIFNSRELTVIEMLSNTLDEYSQPQFLPQENPK